MPESTQSTTVSGTRSVPMVNGRAWEFSYNGWDYQMVSLNGSDKVRLSFRTTQDGAWQYGHTREMNGEGAAYVARQIHAYITRQTTS